MNAGTTKPIQVIAITSGKGGVGKTSIASNLGVALAMAGRKPLLLDADLGLANVDVMLGLSAQRTLAGVIRGDWSLRDTLIEGPHGLRVAPASSGVKRMTDLSAREHAGVINAFAELAGEIDVLLVDTGAGIGDNVIVYARAAHDVIVVVCDEPASMTDAYALIKVLSRDYGVQRFRIVTNKVDSEDHGRRLYQQLLSVTDRFLSVTPDYMGCIPSDNYMRKAMLAQRAVVDAYPLSKAANSFNQLIQQLDNWQQPQSASGYLEFFVEQASRPGNPSQKPPSPQAIPQTATDAPRSTAGGPS